MLKKLSILCLLLTSLYSCSPEEKERKVLSGEIKAFSTFYFSYDGEDTVRHYIGTTVLFKKDSLVILQTGKNDRYEISKIALNEKHIDTINKMISRVKFYSHVLKKKRVYGGIEMPLYCGPHIGFTDSLGQPQACFSEDLYQPACALMGYFRRFRRRTTTDTSEIIKYTEGIKKRFMQMSPPPPRIETIKFVPPIIKENEIEEVKK